MHHSLEKIRLDAANESTRRRVRLQRRVHSAAEAAALAVTAARRRTDPGRINTKRAQDLLDLGATKKNIGGEEKFWDEEKNSGPKKSADV